MGLVPNPRQAAEKITLFRPQVLKEALVLQNIKTWVYEALPDERQNAYTITDGKCNASIKTLLNASVQDHRRSAVFYSKAGSALPVIVLTDFYQTYSEK